MTRIYIVFLAGPLAGSEMLGAMATLESFANWYMDAHGANSLRIE